jgi:hypothetical protein
MYHAEVEPDDLLSCIVEPHVTFQTKACFALQYLERTGYSVVTTANKQKWLSAHT